MDGDGVADSGIFDGVKHYELGLYDTYERLGSEREAGQYMRADSSSWVNNQIFVGVFSGIENGGWPYISDPSADKWSEGINRLYFWRQMAERESRLIYINHKPGQCV